MPNVVTLPKQDSQGLDNMQAQLAACLAMSRATLQALAVLSPMVARTAAEVLEEEVEIAASAEARRIIGEIRDELDRPAAARALERALIGAAENLPRTRARARRIL